MLQQHKALAAALLASTPILVRGASGNYAYFTDRDSGGGVSLVLLDQLATYSSNELAKETLH
jgi:hypothetical protein